MDVLSLALPQEDQYDLTAQTERFLSPEQKYDLWAGMEGVSCLLRGRSEGVTRAGPDRLMISSLTAWFELNDRDGAFDAARHVGRADR